MPFENTPEISRIRANLLLRITPRIAPEERTVMHAEAAVQAFLCQAATVYLARHRIPFSEELVTTLAEAAYDGWQHCLRAAATGEDN